MEGAALHQSQSPSSKRLATRRNRFSLIRVQYAALWLEANRVKGTVCNIELDTVDVTVAALKGEKVIVWVYDEAQGDICTR